MWESVWEVVRQVDRGRGGLIQWKMENGALQELIVGFVMEMFGPNPGHELLNLARYHSRQMPKLYKSLWDGDFSVAKSTT